IAQALAPFRGKTIRPGELLMALMVSDEIEAELGAPLLGLWHRVEGLSSRGLGFHAVVEELTLATTEKRRERDVPPPKNEGQLQVLTLHGAKGLEFKQVLLIDLGKKSKSPSSPLLFWDRERGAFLSRRDEWGDRDKSDSEEIHWRELEKTKSIAESKRLFYVAMTRAMERLILVCPELEDPLKGENILGEDYWRGWLELNGTGIAIEQNQVQVQIQTPQGETKAVTDLKKRRVLTNKKPERNFRPRHSVTEWNLLSRCERAYEWTYIRPQLGSSEIELDGIFTADPDSVSEPENQAISHRELGTRVHALLETGDFQGLKLLEAEVGPERFVAEPVIHWAKTSPWMISPTPGTLEKVWTELSFEVPLHGQVVVGAMDRLVRKKEGTYTVLDFKITLKTKSEAEISETYRTQMELYGWALKSLIRCEDLKGIQVLLVNISREGVRTFSIPLKAPDVEGLKKVSSQIVNGAAGIPYPGSLCRYCPHLAQCSEGQASGGRPWQLEPAAD
ncbi:MAG: 3'-5' exonuclease, partial [Bdellovibrionota bacterium]